MEKDWIVDGKFKELTFDQFKALPEDLQKEYHAAKAEAQSKERAELQKRVDELDKKEGDNSAEIIKLQKEINEKILGSFEALEKGAIEQGLEIAKLIEGGVAQNDQDAIKTFIADNAEQIKTAYDSGQGFVEYKSVNDLGQGKVEHKAVGPIETTSASLPTAAPALVGTQIAPAGTVNLRAPFINELVTSFNTSMAAYPYTYSEPKDGDFSFVLEKGTKPQIDFLIKTEWAAPVKIAAHEILTTESVQDIVGLQSIATDLLKKKHDLKRQNGILFGDGISPNPKGATEYGRVFVPGAMADKFSLGETNIMDVINACIVDISTTHNFADEEPYIANLALMNTVDFFLELVSAKDADGHPLYPSASLFNRVVIGGVLIIPKEEIPAGKLFVADLGTYRVSNYIPYSVKIGWINDQFITNQFTMVGESRFHAFVKKHDEQVFIYDDIATIKLGLETV